MRILVLHNRYQQRGGEDVVVDREVALLRHHGETVLLSLRENDEINSGLSKLKTAIQCGYSEEARSAVDRLIQKFRPDVCHVHNFFPLFTPSVYDACVSAGVPVIQTLHNYRLFCANGLFSRDGRPCELCLGRGPWPAVRYACYRGSRLATLPVARMIKQHRDSGTWETKVDHFVALTEFAKAKFIEGGIPSERISVKHNFSEDFSLRRAPGTYAVFLGRLSTEKGLETLFNSWHLGFPKLIVVGEGVVALSPAAKKPNIELLGRREQSEAMRILAGAAFLILPTECYEGAFPLVLIEAMSLGIPVLASRIGGIPEVLTNRANALLFAPGNPADCARAVGELLADSSLAEKIGAAGRATYEAFFTPEASYRAMRAIYNGVIEKRRKK